MGDRGGHIFLIGFSGSGKTTVGKALARALGRPFVNTDSVIARQCRMTIPELFARHGEAYFRKLEHSAIRTAAVSGRKAKVIALGGGAFESPANRKVVADTGISVWLSCSAREIYRRLQAKRDRPLLQVSLRQGETQRQAVLRRISALLQKRLPNYRHADLRVATTKRDIQSVVKEITQWLESRYGSY